jgi:hypothetical protein
VALKGGIETTLDLERNREGSLYSSNSTKTNLSKKDSDI